MSGSKSERGEGGFKAIVALVLVVYAILCAAKLLPAWSDDKAIQAKTQEILKFAGTNRLTTTDMAFKIFETAKDMNLGLKQEDITVEEDGETYRARFTYSREIKLVVYTYRKTHRIDVKQVKY